MAEKNETQTQYIKIGTSEFNDWSQILGGRNTVTRSQYRLAVKPDLNSIDRAQAKAELLAELARITVAAEAMTHIANAIEI